MMFAKENILYNSGHEKPINTLGFPRRYPLIDAGACHHYLEKLFHLMSYWEEKQHGFFYTLGLPAYQHSHELQRYQTENKHLNVLLWHQFGDLYRLVLGKIESILGEGVSFHESFAIPGFHIYLYNEVSFYPGGGPHFDISYHSIVGDPGDYRGVEENYSFNLSLALPAQGSGLDYWDRTCFDDQQHPMSNNEVVAKYPRLYCPYEVGELCIFSGNLMHQISRLEHLQPTDRRITLQGHVFRHNNNLIAYW